MLRTERTRGKKDLKHIPYEHGVLLTLLSRKLNCTLQRACSFYIKSFYARPIAFNMLNVITRSKGMLSTHLCPMSFMLNS